MRIGSLRARLLAAAGLAIAAALTVSGVLLGRLFSDHVENRTAVELQDHLNQLAAGLETDAEGRIVPATAPADPRFSQLYGGLYWQIDPSGGQSRRSRSLWDFELELPTDALSEGAIHRHDISGPDRATLFAVERALKIGMGEEQKPIRIIVAVDRREIDDAVAQFRAMLWRSLLIVGAVLLTAFAAMLHFGLLPLRTLRSSLHDVQTGARERVEGRFPTELEALVDDLNRLLAQQRQSVVRAREQAGDLAHGFKTPLSLLAVVARDLRRGGRSQPADEIDAQIEAMSRHVQKELTRARMAGASGIVRNGVLVRPVAERIVSAMRRIGGDRDLSWSIEGAQDLRFAGDENDLLEIIGNLAENAAKWAQRRVVLTIEMNQELLEIDVEDDGPGIPNGSEAAALARGGRLDERAEGTGLGLDIVAKAVAIYAGRIDLSRSRLGGLRARLTLPAIDPAKLTGA